MDRSDFGLLSNTLADCHAIFFMLSYALGGAFVGFAIALLISGGQDLLTQVLGLDGGPNPIYAAKFAEVLFDIFQRS